MTRPLRQQSGNHIMMAPRLSVEDNGDYFNQQSWGASRKKSSFIGMNNDSSSSSASSSMKRVVSSDFIGMAGDMAGMVGERFGSGFRRASEGMSHKPEPELYCPRSCVHFLTCNADEIISIMHIVI